MLDLDLACGWAASDDRLDHAKKFCCISGAASSPDYADYGSTTVISGCYKSGSYPTTCFEWAAFVPFGTAFKGELGVFDASGLGSFHTMPTKGLEAAGHPPQSYRGAAQTGSTLVLAPLLENRLLVLSLGTAQTPSTEGIGTWKYVPVRKAGYGGAVAVGGKVI